MHDISSMQILDCANEIVSKYQSLRPTEHCFIVINNLLQIQADILRDQVHTCDALLIDIEVLAVFW